MSKVLHLPGGDKEVPTSQEEILHAQMAAQQEAQMRKWVEQEDPVEISAIRWDEIGSDPEAKIVMESLGEFAQAFTMARIMHHSAIKGSPPKTIGITLQIRTFDENDQVLEDEHVDLSSLAQETESPNDTP